MADIVKTEGGKELVRLCWTTSVHGIANPEDRELAEKSVAEQLGRIFAKEIVSREAMRFEHSKDYGGYACGQIVFYLETPT